MLNQDQIYLLWHLSVYPVADRTTCYRLLRDQSEREQPEYGLRTLKRWGYVTQRKDGLYGITQKGLDALGKDKCTFSCGGNAQARARMAQLARVGALLQVAGVRFGDQLYPGFKDGYYIPSPWWREIRQGIISTTRFHAMLIWGDDRLAVYDIGDGTMEWQLYAERSLFFENYGGRDDRANGMLLICRDGCGVEVAQKIIRETLPHRKRVLAYPASRYYYESDKKQRYFQSPIRLHRQYGRVFLTEERDLHRTLGLIHYHQDEIAKFKNRWEGSHAPTIPAFWHLEKDGERGICNFANDLLLYLSYIDAVMDGDRGKWMMVVTKPYGVLMDRYRENLTLGEREWVTT